MSELNEDSLIATFVIEQALDRLRPLFAEGADVVFMAFHKDIPGEVMYLSTVPALDVLQVLAHVVSNGNEVGGEELRSQIQDALKATFEPEEEGKGTFRNGIDTSSIEYRERKIGHWTKNSDQLELHREDGLRVAYVHPSSNGFTWNTYTFGWGNARSEEEAMILCEKALGITPRRHPDA